METFKQSKRKDKSICFRNNSILLSFLIKFKLIGRVQAAGGIKHCYVEKDGRERYILVCFLQLRRLLNICRVCCLLLNEGKT